MRRRAPVTTEVRGETERQHLDSSSSEASQGIVLCSQCFSTASQQQSLTLRMMNLQPKFVPQRSNSFHKNINANTPHFLIKLLELLNCVFSKINAQRFPFKYKVKYLKSTFKIPIKTAPRLTFGLKPTS